MSHQTTGAQEPRLLSTCAASTEARAPWSPRSTREATTMRSPLTTTREKTSAATKTQHSQTQINEKYVKNFLQSGPNSSFRTMQKNATKF